MQRSSHSYSLKFLLVSILCFSLHSSVAFGQFQLKGRILDAETLEPLLFATVFISNSSIGTSTNKKGEFELSLPEGNHELIISYIGFQTFSYPISTSVLRPFYEFRILPDIVELEESEVKEKRDKAWYENLEVFEKYFLGNSINGSSCKILNPEVLILDGETEPGLLTARAKDILEIENPNLGYNIKYVLSGFELNKVKNELAYAGYAFFVEEDLPKRRMKKITENREKAYLGSIMHFMRTLYQGNAESSGFKIFATQKIPSPKAGSKINLDLNQNSQLIMEEIKEEEKPELKLIPTDSIDIPYSEPQAASTLTQSSKDGKVFIIYNKPVYVLYTLEEEESAFFSYSLRNINFTIGNIGSTESNTTGIKVSQLSKLEMRSKAVQVFDNGSYFHPYDIFVQGYMGWEKIGDQMPLDYGIGKK